MSKQAINAETNLAGAAELFSRSAVCSKSNAWRENIASKVKGDPHLLKGFLLFLQVFGAQAFETTLCPITRKERVHLRTESVIALTQANRPGFLLKRFKSGLGRVLMQLPMFKDGHLVVDKRLGFALHYLQNARVFLIERQNAGVAQVVLRIALSGGSLLHRDGVVFLVDIF